MLWGLALHYLLAAIWRASEIGRFWAAAYALEALLCQGSWWPIPAAAIVWFLAELAYLGLGQAMARWEASFYPRAVARLACEAATKDVRRRDYHRAQIRATQARDLGDLVSRHGCRLATNATALATSVVVVLWTAGWPGLLVLVVLAVTACQSRRVASVCVAARAQADKARSEAAAALGAASEQSLLRYEQALASVAAAQRRQEVAEADADLAQSASALAVTLVVMVIALAGGASLPTLAALYRGLSSLAYEAGWMTAGLARMAEAKALWRELRK